MSSSEDNSSNSGFLLLIIAISMAAFMSSLDGTIVNIALPTISEAFDISSGTVSWVATSYLLVMAGCVLIFGKISDVIGFKRVFLSGFIIFTTGSFACGFIPEILNSFSSLVGSRVLQAVGGAMITAIAPAMITAFIPMDQKGKAMGIIMTVAALGTAIGPTIGGLLTQYLSWHWIFYINVPVGVVALFLGARVIPSTVKTGKLKGFDKGGAAFIFIGLATLLFAVSEGQALGWTSPVILLSAVLAVFSLGYFVWHELKTAEPLLDIRLFKNRNFIFTNMMMALVFFSFAGINYLLPFYLQYVQGFDTSTAGLILTSLSFAMMVSGIIAGMLINKTGCRVLCIAAGIIISAGYFMTTLLRVDSTMSFVIMCLLVIGFGLGLIITPASNMIMNSVSRKYQGMVSSLTSLERFAPMTIGIAISNLIFVQGILTIASHRGIVQDTPASMKLEVLTAGFDLAFFASFIIGIIVLILAVISRQEIHPDYLSSKNGEDDSTFKI
ncbi:MFS transporter [Methanoplanus sp. FWC-SCC4]|uniref:MFS transporter n=1 Tax=Methanochimaera problematica TaxID=2609417 RepID=A0AA97I397_9EURY|nr:MFS transporter [Methanoplanus sp. FWC-SCC4]WOF15656.1 MFS transporter [Methanoplanus sp. FWC-SCC4]